MIRQTTDSAGQALSAWGTATNWRGFAAREADFEGFRLVIVEPSSPRAGRRWVWKTEFLDAFAHTEEALLRHGFYLVHLGATDLYGSPRAVGLGNALHGFLTAEFAFAERVGLDGLSRGGLWAYNWAAANPRKVAALYADNPVCDFKSWPAGWGSGPGSAGDWQKCLGAYGLTAEEARDYSGNPVDNLAPLAAANIPILHVIGDADDVVPVAENSNVAKERYRTLGGSFEEIVKAGGKHHPHGLEDPAPIAEFFEGWL